MKAKHDSRGAVKGINKADGDKVTFLELYKKLKKKNRFMKEKKLVSNKICGQQSGWSEQAEGSPSHRRENDPFMV